MHSEIGKGSKFSFLIPLTLSGEMSSDPGALSDLLEATAESNICMDAPHNGEAIEAPRIDSLQESSNHMGELPGNRNNMGGVRADFESSNVPPPIVPLFCGTSYSSNSAALRVLIVEVCIYLLFWTLSHWLA